MAECHVDCCSEEGWGDQGENGRDDIGSERLSVEMGDGRVAGGDGLIGAEREGEKSTNRCNRQGLGL